MDYGSGTELNRFQWDAIHNPAIIGKVFQDDADGAEISNFVSIIDNPSVSQPATFFAPSGLPIVIQGGYDKLWIAKQNIDNNIRIANYLEGVPIKVKADKGTIIAFGMEINGKSIPKHVAGTITNSDDRLIFSGYSDYIDNVTPGLKTHNIYFWDETGKLSTTNYCFDVNKFKQAIEFNSKGYSAIGYYADNIDDRVLSSCKPLSLDGINITWYEYKKGTKSTTFNKDGNGGKLKVVEYAGKTYNFIEGYKNDTWLIYAYDDLFKDYYLYPIPGFNSNDLLDAGFYSFLTNEYGHTALDIVGLVPVAGEAADILNGLWYVFEGDKGNSLLCFSGSLPLIGDFATSSKFVLKGIKDKKFIEGSYTLSKTAVKNFGEIDGILKAADASLADECIEKFAKLLHDLPDEHLEEVKRLAQEIPIAKQSAVLAKLGDLSEAERIAFLDDIKLSGGTLGSNLDKLDESVVDAWKTFKNSGSELCTNFDELTTLSTLQKSNNFGWTIDNFETALTKLNKQLSSGSVFSEIDNAADAVTDEAIDLIVGQKLTDSEIIGVLKKLNDNPVSGMDKMLKELCCETSWKAVGAEMVLRTVEKGNLWGKIKEFEVTDNGIGGIRYIDILIEDGGRQIRMEVKSWKKMYPSTFIKQFVEKDMANVSSLQDMKWMFDGKYEGVLKDDILKTLKSTNGKAALNNLPSDKKLLFFPTYDDLLGISDANIETFINSNYNSLINVY